MRTYGSRMNNLDDSTTIGHASDGLLSKRGLAPKLQISTRTLDDWMRKK
jgi:hypothetical protein